VTTVTDFKPSRQARLLVERHGKKGEDLKDALIRLHHDLGTWEAVSDLAGPHAETIRLWARQLGIQEGSRNMNPKAA
jgi:hypothetical protein